MKSLKFVLVSIVLALGFAAPAAVAQDSAPKAKQGARGDNFAPLLKGITLTADQQTKVDALRAEVKKKVQDLAQEERRAKAPEIMKDYGQKVRAVLTDEQQAKFDENLKAAKQHRAGGKGGDKGGKGGDKSKGKDKGAKPAAGSDE